jgi:hypothetical protein
MLIDADNHSQAKILRYSLQNLSQKIDAYTARQGLSYPRSVLIKKHPKTLF